MKSTVMRLQMLLMVMVVMVQSTTVRRRRTACLHGQTTTYLALTGVPPQRYHHQHIADHRHDEDDRLNCHLGTQQSRVTRPEPIHDDGGRLCVVQHPPRATSTGQCVRHDPDRRVSLYYHASTNLDTGNKHSTEISVNLESRV